MTWIDNAGANYYLNISSNNGTINSCAIFAGKVGNASFKNECQVSGLPGSIYKTAAIMPGQMSMGDNTYVAFILENGEVYYVTAQDLSGGSPVAARKMQVGNPVKDIVPVEVGTSGIGSYHSAFLVFPMIATLNSITRCSKTSIDAPQHLYCRHFGIHLLVSFRSKPQSFSQKIIHLLSFLTD